jgi:hypothetical protein
MIAIAAALSRLVKLTCTHCGKQVARDRRGSPCVCPRCKRPLAAARTTR